MPIRKAEAIWEGSLREGAGELKVGSGAFQVPYSWGKRFADEPGTNPEELIAAAHAGCFTMAFSAGLGRAGFAPTRLHTAADVSFEKLDEGFRITRIDLMCQGQVPGIDEATFNEMAEDAKENCPISQALKAVEVHLSTRLLG